MRNELRPKVLEDAVAAFADRWPWPSSRIHLGPELWSQCSESPQVTQGISQLKARDPGYSQNWGRTYTIRSRNASPGVHVSRVTIESHTIEHVMG